MSIDNNAFNLDSILVGFLKAIPVVISCILLVWQLVKIDFAMAGRNIGRVVRHLVLCAVGFIGLWVISIVCYTPYDWEMHPVVVVIMVPFVFIGYVQKMWYDLKIKGLKCGNAAVNRYWMIGFFSLELIALSLYPMNTGIYAHTALSVILLFIYGGVMQYLVWWTHNGSYGLPSDNSRKSLIGDLLVDSALIVIVYFCYKVIEGWPGWIGPQ